MRSFRHSSTNRAASIGPTGRGGVGKRSNNVATTVAPGNAPTRFLRSVFSMMKPPDRPLGIVHSVVSQYAGDGLQMEGGYTHATRAVLNECNRDFAAADRANGSSFAFWYSLLQA